MFSAWGRGIYRHRHKTLAVSALFLALSLALLAHGGTLTTGVIHGTESDNAIQAMNRELPHPPAAGFTLIFQSPTLTTDDVTFAAAVRAAVAPLRTDRRVASVRTPFDPDTSVFVSSAIQSVDSHAALAEVTLRPEAVSDTGLFPSLRAKVHGGPLSVTATGPAAFRSDLDAALARDLQRSEVLSAPVTLLVLLLVFGSLVAASLPVGIGGLAVAGGIALVFALSRITEVAQYAINIVTLVGLGVAIDYSLFMVSRFREELLAGATVPDALARTVATAGRAVVFSGVAVAIGLGGLLFFRGSYLASLGVGGTLVVALSVIYALTFLPALLGVLGHRVNSFSVPYLSRTASAGRWNRLAHAVMRRPIAVLVPTLLVLFAVGIPFRSLAMAIPDVTVLPPMSEARRGDAILRDVFPERMATRIAVVVTFPGDPLGTAARVGALYDLSRSIAALPGVTQVESVVDADPTLDRANTIANFRRVPRDLSEPVSVTVRESVGRTIVVLAAVTDAPPGSATARAIVQRLRRHRAIADGTLKVTGPTAMDLDTARYLRNRLPWAVGFVVGMTFIVLFILLGSVILPVKAVAMNLLSLSASFGALVWIFQQGHLRGVLGFVPGPIEPSLPVVLFCATFGLSMDYEVLLLTRIQEEWLRTHNNTHAVAQGLERSGPLITSAAALMVAVFSAFSFADVILLKVMGVGMALTVALDATVVRTLVVPATMRLFGDLNWWAPDFLRGLQRRVHPTKDPPHRPL